MTQRLSNTSIVTLTLLSAMTPESNDPLCSGSGRSESFQIEPIIMVYMACVTTELQSPPMVEYEEVLPTFGSIDSREGVRDVSSV